MPTDHRVEFRSEQTLARAADNVRNLSRRIGKYTIDMVDLVERVLVERLSKTDGLKLEFFDGDKYDEPAFVEFRKNYPRISLHVRRDVWRDAKLGLSYAYFVLAHEVAHILFHDHRAVAFTNDATLQFHPVVQECRAEWQADTFAKHLTIPDRALRETEDPILLELLCNIERSTVLERVKSYRRSGPMLKVAYDGEACGECGNFTMVRNGTCTKCDSCGNAAGCS